MVVAFFKNPLGIAFLLNNLNVRNFTLSNRILYRLAKIIKLIHPLNKHFHVQIEISFFKSTKIQSLKNVLTHEI